MNNILFEPYCYHIGEIEEEGNEEETATDEIEEAQQDKTENDANANIDENEDEMNLNEENE